MTEAVAASVLVLLASFALFLRDTARGWRWRLVLGLFGALLVLIRPQLLPMLPLLGAASVAVPSEVSGRGAWLRRLSGAARGVARRIGLLRALDLAQLRKMDGCVFVSANGGWNLLIGTLPEGRGSFAPIAGATVPPACREVFGEAGKDRCFGHAGAERIRSAPAAWLELAPQKLGQLFNHNAVASSYLRPPIRPWSPTRSASRSRRSRRCTRGCCCWGHASGCCASRRLVRKRLLALAAAFTLSPWGYVAQLSLLGGLLAERPDRAAGRSCSWLRVCSGCASVTHIVFFGAPRYALIWSPWLAWLLVCPGKAAGRRAGRRSARDSFDSSDAGRG